jgi:hypothetical protein
VSFLELLLLPIGCPFVAVYSRLSVHRPLRKNKNGWAPATRFAPASTSPRSVALRSVLFPSRSLSRAAALGGGHGGHRRRRRSTGEVGPPFSSSLPLSLIHAFMSLPLLSSMAGTVGADAGTTVGGEGAASRGWRWRRASVGAYSAFSVPHFTLHSLSRVSVSHSSPR